MKKILIAITMFVISMQTHADKISYSISSGYVDNVLCNIITATLTENTSGAKGFQINLNGLESVNFVSAEAVGNTQKQQNDMPMYNLVSSATSNENCPVIFAYWNSALGPTAQEFDPDKLCVININKNCHTIITIEAITDNNGIATPMPAVAFDLGNLTAIDEIEIDDNGHGDIKFIDGNHIVIKKGGKQYNAIGVRLK